MSLPWNNYLSNAQYESDNKSLQDFASDFMLALKIKNISEGINATQALWIHHRLRAWDVQLPAQMGGFAYTVDVMNMIVAGDIETATISLIYGTADDMTMPYHWLSTERLAYIVGELKIWLGWP